MIRTFLTKYSVPVVFSCLALIGLALRFADRSLASRTEKRADGIAEKNAPQAIPNIVAASHTGSFEDALGIARGLVKEAK